MASDCDPTTSDRDERHITVPERRVECGAHRVAVEKALVQGKTAPSAPTERPNPNQSRRATECLWGETDQAGQRQNAKIETTSISSICAAD
jgi:hypothetical protein